MKRATAAQTADERWPRLWRMLVIGMCALILCSCRGPVEQSCNTCGLHPQTYTALPEEAYTGAPPSLPPEECPSGGVGMEQGVPLPYVPSGPWSPPGIRKPWPPDEYVRDGGDAGLPAEVGNQWEVRGLELEDTIAHYDTLDGRTVVEPTNPVHVYCPRFRAVRKVTSVRANQQMDRAADVHLPTTPLGPTTTQLVAASTQNVQADRQIGTKPPAIFRSKQGDGLMSTANKARAFQDAFLPYENLKLVREGIFDSAEMAWLARGINNAIVWSHKQAVQVILDHQAAMADVSDQSSTTVYTIKAPPGEPKLRLVKVASTPFAEPGDEVAFTIRFDNVGNQVIGNVTIIDNLSPRLEYVPDSAQCSVEAAFYTEPNEGDSLVIRCEIADPLPPNQGGILRFRCRVR